jgi:hypothetical protein
LANDNLVTFAQAHGHFALGIGAAGNGVDHVLEQAAGCAGNFTDCLKNRGQAKYVKK